MDRSRFCLGVIVACSTVAVAACHDGSNSPLDTDDVDVPLEPATVNIREEPPAGANGMLPSCFWASGAQQALRTLGGAALHQGGNSLPAVSPSLVPAECRHVLQYTVECALPRGQALQDPVTEAYYEGWWGLAAGWWNAALDLDGRRYVTGCLVQRLNATGARVPLALEGPHPAIEQDAAVAGVFSLEESTVFGGDLFSSPTLLGGLLPAFDVFACTEDVLPQSCGALGLPLLGERMCDDAPLCGFVSLGPCSLVCAPNGPYNKCKTGLFSPWWTQTVRVRLDPATCE